MPAHNAPEPTNAKKQRRREANRVVSALFGKNLVRLRRRAGVSQEELGFRADLHRTAIGLLERGEREPQLDTIVKLAGALRVPPAEMFEGVELPEEGSRNVGDQRPQ